MSLRSPFAYVPLKLRPTSMKMVPCSISIPLFTCQPHIVDVGFHGMRYECSPLPAANPSLFGEVMNKKVRQMFILVKNFVSFCTVAHIPDLESEKPKTSPKLRGKRPSQRRVRRGHMTMRALTRITSCASGEKTTRRPPMVRKK